MIDDADGDDDTPEEREGINAMVLNHATWFPDLLPRKCEG
jgi:hypothetical protein